MHEQKENFLKVTEQSFGGWNTILVVKILYQQKKNDRISEIIWSEE